MKLFKNVGGIVLGLLVTGQIAAAQSVDIEILDPNLGNINVGSSITSGTGIRFTCNATSACGAASVTAVGLTGNSDFTIVNDGCTGFGVSSLPPGGTTACFVAVQFRPSSVGLKTASLEADFVGANQSSFIDPYSGTGVEKTISDVNSGTGTTVCSNSAINIDARSYSENIPMTGLAWSLNYDSGRLRNLYFDVKALGLGGWTPSILHGYSNDNHILYNGNGSIRNAKSVPSGTNNVVTNEDGSELYVFSPTGRLQATLDGLTGVIKLRFLYDTRNRISAIQDKYGNVTRFSYTSTGGTITSPYGQVTSFTYDANGFLASVTNPNLETYRSTYAATGQLLTFQKPMGQTSQVSYDNDGYVTKDQGAGGDFISLIASFDKNSKTQTVISSSALQRNTTYQTIANDSTSSSHQTIYPTGETLTSSNHDLGTNSSVSSTGVQNSYTLAADPRFPTASSYTNYNEFSIANSNIKAISQTTKTADLANPADPFSLRTLTTTTTLQNDPSRTFKNVYVASSKTSTVTSPMGRSSSRTLNSAGDLTKIQVSNLEPTNLTYDSRGNISSISQGTRTTSLSYGSTGTVSQVTDALGQVTRYAYDNSNRVISRTNPDGTVVQMTYDKNGNLTSITPSGRPSHSFSFNLFEQVSEYNPPMLSQYSSVSTKYSYDLEKKLTGVSLPDGKSIQYNYASASGLLNSVTTSDGNISYSYQPNSSLIAQTRSIDNVTTSYSYLGKLPTEIKNSGVVNSDLIYSYNDDVTLKSINVVGGKVANYAYDKDGLMIGVLDEAISRNDFGAAQTISVGSISESLSFDNFGDVTGRSISRGSKTLWTQNYTRDSLGRIQNVQDQEFDHDFWDQIGVTYRAYQYDQQNRLVSVAGNNHLLRSYKYDDNGNRISVTNASLGLIPGRCVRNGSSTITATYDDQDRLLTYGNAQFSYDARGNVIQKTEMERGPVAKFDRHQTSYQYDTFGNLKKVVIEGKVIEYILDSQGRRIGKKINGKLVQEFVYQSGTQIAAELDGNNKIVRQFVYGTRSNVPDLMIYKGNEYRILSNQVGTPRFVVDVKSGKIVEEESLDEYGVPEKFEMIGNDFKQRMIPFGFAGGIYDLDTGLVHFGAREYNPEIGRWMQKDPIGFGGGDTNLYGYVENEPNNNIDSKGTGPLAALVCFAALRGASFTLPALANQTAGDIYDAVSNDSGAKSAICDPNVQCCDDATAGPNLPRSIVQTLATIAVSNLIERYGATACAALLGAPEP